ncbi:hypothetical protein AB0D13_41225 [Streptomyces sp. NPDC048430]|uniref:hypothetical protein n=1 Tax=Streptomyces sp. NPDC048430 TaxID=3155388 RepID=UPI003427A222
MGDDGENALIAWLCAGVVAGLALVGKVHATGALPDDGPFRIVAMGALMVGPLLLFLAIGDQLIREVIQGKISRATYWTTVFGLAVSSFALLGIAGVDDLIAVFDKQG